VEARRRGLGTAAVRTVVVLGDGAHWIWERVRPFLCLPGVEVVEIVDIYHAYQYLWAVGNALYGTGSLEAAAWVAPLKEQLSRHGAAPILTALAALAPSTEEAVRAIADAQTYFTGLSAVCRAAVSDWLGSGGECLQGPSGSTAQAGRHALGRPREPSHRQSTRLAALRALGGLLADAP
jgi:hypothetical protein